MTQNPETVRERVHTLGYEGKKIICKVERKIINKKTFELDNLTKLVLVIFGILMASLLFFILKRAFIF